VFSAEQEIGVELDDGTYVLIHVQSGAVVRRFERAAESQLQFVSGKFYWREPGKELRSWKPASNDEQVLGSIASGSFFVGTLRGEEVITVAAAPSTPEPPEGPRSTSAQLGTWPPRVPASGRTASLH
jgi:hypothetical protein